jgi:hypothetical protein
MVLHPCQSSEDACSQLHVVVTVVLPTVVVVTEENGTLMLNAESAIIPPSTSATTTTPILKKRPITGMAMSSPNQSPALLIGTVEAGLETASRTAHQTWPCPTHACGRRHSHQAQPEPRTCGRHRSPEWVRDARNRGSYPAPVVTRRYVELMNGRYQRILDVAWGEANLDLRYDGEEWTAMIAVRPAPARNRFVSGSGVTLEYALADLEKELALERWTG